VFKSNCQRTSGLQKEYYIIVHGLCCANVTFQNVVLKEMNFRISINLHRFCACLSDFEVVKCNYNVMFV
jgi:hypothetical protein